MITLLRFYFSAIICLSVLLLPDYLFAQTPQYFKDGGTASTSNQIPLSAANNATHCQQIYTPSDFATLPPSGFITHVYMRNTNAAESGTYTNFEINFLQDTLTRFANATFLTGFTNALTNPSLVINGGVNARDWFAIPLTVPFYYDNTKSLVYEIKYTNRTGGIATLNTTSVGNKRLSIVAVPGPTTGNLATTWMDFGFDLAPATLCNPATLAPGTTTASRNIVCSGETVMLNLTGNTFANGISYQWEKASLPTGPWIAEGGSQTTTPRSVTPPVGTTFYRAQVICGSTSMPSVEIAVTVNPALTANTYTINNTVPTTYPTGTNFTSFTDAFNALNCGVTGNVVFNVSAGQVFTENPPSLEGSGSASASITFQRSGVGANPVIEPATAGTIASSTTVGSNGDAVIVINGGDYISFDGIDINASNFTNGADQFEYGYFLKRKSATDGCKNVTIKHSTITLTKAIHSFGIYSSNISGTATVTVISLPGINENIKISGNTINGSYGGIMVRGQATAAYYDNNIEVGVDSGNVVNSFGGGATIAYGIYAISENNLKIGKNIITSATNGQTTAALYGIYTGTATNANTDIYDNTITLTGSGTTGALYAIQNNAGGTGTNNLIRIYNNTITGFTYTSATTGAVYGIDQEATAYDVALYGNKITNNTHNPSAGGLFYLLYQNAAVVNSSTIYNNIIEDNSRASGTTAAMYCIYNTGAATSNNKIYGNLITNNTMLSSTTDLTGIHVVTAATNSVYNNKITGLLVTSTGAGSVYGITIASGADTNKVYNNFISDLNAPTSTTTSEVIRGINILSTTANSVQNIWYNTVYLNAIGSGANFGSAAIYHTGSTTVAATTSALTMFNNIFVNTSVPNGSQYASAYRRSTTGNNNFIASNNNLFHTGTGANEGIFWNGTNLYNSLSAYKIAFVGKDQASIDEMPPFISIVNPIDLHLQTTVATQIESGGIALPAVTTDIDGNLRNTTTPDIGADEFAGIPIDLSGPVIVYTPVTRKSICISAPVLSATITDPSNVNVAAGTKPRLWFKKSTDNDALPVSNTSAGNGWKYVEATNTTSPFTFTMDYTLLTSPVTGGDSISYFIAAQDMAATPNVGINNGTFTLPPASVALSTAVFPITGTVNGYMVTPQPSTITIKSTRTSICNSGTVKLDTLGIDVVGGEYQWQSAPAGTTNWTDISGGTTLPFTTPVIASATDFRLIVKCGGAAISVPSQVLTVTIDTPKVTSTLGGATTCGAGTANLQATGNTGTTLNWYATATGGVPLGTGASFTTPTISSTTDFYVGASLVGSGSGLGSVGLPTYFPNPTSGAGLANFGLVFDALTNFTLHAVDIYPISATPNLAGTVTIDVIDGSNTVINTATVNVVANPSTAPVVQTVILNFAIPAGTNYKLRPSARSTGISGLFFDPAANAPTTNKGYPFVIPGIVSINTSTLSAAPGNTANNALYYYFYNWQVLTDCESPRTPVTATVAFGSGLPTVAANVTNTQADGSTQTYTNASCQPIAKITDTAGGNVLGSITASVTIDASVQNTPSGDKYLQRHYNFTPASNGTATVVLYASQQEFNNYNNAPGVFPPMPSNPTDPNAANVRVTKYSGTAFTLPADLITPTSVVWNGSNNWWEITIPVTTLNSFYIHTGGFPLPITLTSIHASNAGTRNHVNWITSKEENAARFELERSLNGKEFSKLDVIAAKGSSSRCDYIDESPFQGINYYRLKMYENSGRFVYSNVVSATVVSKDVFALNAYPNPVSNMLMLQVTGVKAVDATIEITDITGKLIQTHSMSDMKISVDMSVYANGVYLVKYHDADRSETIRISKQ